MNIKLYNPHDKQKAIHQACMPSDESFFVTVVAGRRGGKSLCAINQALFWAFKDEGSMIWYVSPTDSQSEVVINEMSRGFFEQQFLIKKINNSKGDRTIEFNNGSVISFKSALSNDSLRGSKVNYMIVDEAAFINNNIFNSVLMPSMSVGGKKVLIISTPKGRNWFYEYYVKGIATQTKRREEKYKSFKFTSQDNPYVDKELIELFKSSVPEAVFQQEYLGRFIDAAAVFKFVNEICVLNKKDVKELKTNLCFAGIDIGMLHDNTVITILNSDGKMLFQDAFTGLEAPELKERILKVLNEFKPRITLIEENNQGLPLMQDLSRLYKGRIEGFYTTNESKEEIINQLVASFSSKEIQCLKDEDLITELNAFIFELTPSRKIRYAAANGFHDDRVISLALAYHLFYNNSRGRNGVDKDRYISGKDETGNALIDKKQGTGDLETDLKNFYSGKPLNQGRDYNPRIKF